MRFFDFLSGSDINLGVQECTATSGGILLDVHTPQEYNDGHIPGSINVPLQSLSGVESISPKKDAPLFTYCHSGVRSRQAAGLLVDMGYTNVKNIGGIIEYTGEMET